MMQRNVAPEHEAPVIRLQDFAYTIEVFEINCADTFGLSLDFALAFTKLECFI